MSVAERKQALERELHWRKAAKDPVFFLENYWNIRVPGKGALPMKLRQAQKDGLRHWRNNRFSLTLKARQIGWTTLVSGYQFWLCFFGDHIEVIDVSRNEDEAKGIIRKTKLGYDMLPNWMRDRGPHLVKDNREELEFSNGSRIVSKPSRENPARGSSADLVVIDEWAFLPNPEEAWASIEPVADAGGSIIGLSTANGSGNFFHELWVGAETKNNRFATMFHPWSASETRDQAWYEQKRRELPSWQLAQEYPCIAEGERVGSPIGLVPIEQTPLSSDVSVVVRKGVKPVVRLTTSLGYTLRCTPDHRMLQADGTWVEAQHAESVVLRPPQFADGYYRQRLDDLPAVDRSIVVDERLGLWLGLFMGDGSCSGTTVSLVGDEKDPDVLDCWSKLCHELWGVTPAERTVGSSGGGRELRFASRAVAATLDSMGLLKQRPSGGVIRDVHVPECIWRSPMPVVREFLRGLFEADGFSAVEQHRVVLFTKYEQFARDVQLLLLGFGLVSHLRRVEKKSSGNHPYVGYEITLGGERADEFHERIGFLSKRKRSRRALPTKFRTRNELVDVVSHIGSDGEAVVWDLTTKDHTFDANGLVVHNCSAEEAFVKSGNPVFDPDVLATQRSYLRVPKHTGYLHEVTSIRNVELRPSDGPLSVWELPMIGEVYTIGADTSEGLEHGDYSSAHVVKHSNGEVVAHWHGHIDPDLYGVELAKLGWWYNTALIAPESNNHGVSVIGSLRRLSYPRLYRQKRLNSTNNSWALEYGWKTTARTKPDLINRLVSSLREGDLWVVDEATLAELRTYRRDERGRMNGSPYDDRVVSLALAEYARDRVNDPVIQESVDDYLTLDWWARQVDDQAAEWVIGTHLSRR